MADDSLNIPDDDSLELDANSAADSLVADSAEDSGPLTAATQRTASVVPRSGTKTIHVTSS